jgi:D-lyxose ketol-isomerase
MKKCDVERYKKEAIKYFKKAHIVITEEEKERIEIADLGLNKFEEIGLAILTYVNTERVCAKEMVLLPHQICPEHMHPTNGSVLGKEETFRVRYGTIHLHLMDEKTLIKKQLTLNPGDQYTLYPNTYHWFQSGDEGAVISEFSTRSTDELDVFTDKSIVRAPKIEE